MEVISAYLGLSVAYIIIVAILLYAVLKTDLYVVAKVFIITIVMWYGLVLFYTPPKLMGWPTIQELPYDSEVMILNFLIREPIAGNSGGIYFWLIKKDEGIELSIVDQLNPKNIFDYDEKNAPRSYKIPYTRELHKELMEKRKAAGKLGGYIVLRRNKQKAAKSSGKNRRSYKSEFKVKIFNPQTILKKK